MVNVCKTNECELAAAVGDFLSVLSVLLNEIENVECNEFCLVFMWDKGSEWKIRAKKHHQHVINKYTIAFRLFYSSTTRIKAKGNATVNTIVECIASVEFLLCAKNVANTKI